MLRAFFTVGFWTMLSRILGFIRDIMIAFVLGTGAWADAFFVAFRFPNLFRRWFAEGAFNSAFVPLFAKELEGAGRDEARRFAEEALSVLLFTLLIFIALAQIFMPWLVYALAPGFKDDPEKFTLTVLLTRITFPYLLLISLMALLSGVLNALHRFTAAAAAPILLNVVFIATLALIAWLGLGDSPSAAKLMAWGVAVAGVLQLLVVMVAVKLAGMGLRLRLPRLTPRIKRLVALGVPGAIAGGITQLNIFIGTIIASLQAGAVSYLYYADRLYQLPLGVIGIAIGVVLLPELSRRLRAGDMAAVHDSQNRSLEFSLLLTLPAAIALFAVPLPIISVLFERGAFTAEAARATAAALQAFAWGLPAFVLVKVFSPGFFAREDTKTPMYFGFVAMLVNVAGSLALFPYLHHVGIALATTLSGWVNAGLLWWTLQRRGLWEGNADIRRRLPRILLASLLMGAALYFGQTPLAPWLYHGSVWLESAALAALVTGGLVAYLLAVVITGAASPRELAGLFRRRAGESRGADAGTRAE